MRTVLCFAFLFFLSVSVIAQNWRTVNPNDTVYFKSGNPAVVNGGPNSGNYFLRVVLVDSVRTTGSDSSYYFFKSLRLEPQVQLYGCLDTLGPSWLGVRMIKKADGTELYQNYFHDTVTIKTNATLGDSWMLAKDTAGNLFQGTVTAIGIDTVNGVADSVKTISIQAFQNATSVSSWYNNFVLVLSKNHGWVKTLDLYQFPNMLHAANRYGAIYDSTQHLRLDKQYFTVLLDTAFWYWFSTTPGNEWIYRTEDNWPATTKITSRQIMSRYSLSSSVVIMNSKIVSYQAVPFIDSTGQLRQHDTVQISNHLDTVVLGNYVYNLMPDPVLPEVKSWPIQGPFERRYYVGSFCNDKLRYIKYENMVPGSILIPDTNCLRFMMGVSGAWWTNSTTMVPFGEFSSLNEFTAGAGGGGIAYYHYRDYDYIKIGSCEWGSKYDVAALSVTEANLKIVNNTISVSPNPATNLVNINVPEKSIQLSVYDMMGRVVRNENLLNGANTLSIGEMPAGLYLFRFSGPNTNYTYKLIKN